MEDLTQQGVYLDDPREEFAEFIPLGAKRIADIGCGKGGFGRTLRTTLGEDAWIVGIESVDEQAHAARSGHGFDEVTSGFFPEATPQSWTDLDLVCFMDVLEHMYDPWLALYNCHDVLAEGGRVLASIPNIQYLPVMSDLVHGRWDYTDTGTLDRTHIRFFTRRAIIEMFYRAGYEVERIEGVRDVLEEWRYRCLRPAGRLLGDSRYLQMAVVARRVERPLEPVSILNPGALASTVRDGVESLARSTDAEQREKDDPITAFRLRGRHLASIEAKFRLGIPTDLACDYGTWRRRMRDARSMALAPSPALTPRAPLAVVIHVYYPELLPALLDQLSVVDVPYDLFITNASGAEVDVTATDAQTTTVTTVENRGRDVWPFMQVVQSGLLDGYDAVLKLHTKKSPQHVSSFWGAASGEEWRSLLVDSLIGSVDAFRLAYESVTIGSGGLACHHASVVGPEAWNTDRRAVRHLARRIGVRCPGSKLRFPAGSIYIMRGSLVPILQSLDMSTEDFEEEDPGSHTTTAHALERLMGYLPSVVGKRVVGLRSPDELGDSVG